MQAGVGVDLVDEFLGAVKVPIVDDVRQLQQIAPSPIVLFKKYLDNVISHITHYRPFYGRYVDYRIVPSVPLGVHITLLRCRMSMGLSDFPWTANLFG